MRRPVGRARFHRLAGTCSLDCAGMHALAFDAQERQKLCDVFDELGPEAPTLLEGWTAHDLAAHIVLRERDLVAGPCIVLPGPFRRFAERRRRWLAERSDFPFLVARIRSGPPAGLFRIGWVRSFPNLNEFFVHHEDEPTGWTVARSHPTWRRRCGATSVEAAAT